MFSRNVDLGPPLRLSHWRKVSLGLWRTAGDPSVYSIVHLDMTETLAYLERLKATEGERGTKITLLQLVGKAIGKMFVEVPQMNCVLRFGQLHPRKQVDVFFQVANDPSGKDLSGVTVRDVPKKSIFEIAQELHGRVQAVRKQDDPGFKKMKKSMSFVPGWCVPLVMRSMSFVLYKFNVWHPLFKIPKDFFGSVMVTNIGALGLNMAFVPLIPSSGVSMVFSLGAIQMTPIVKEGKMVIAPMVQLCTTFDHRLMDGIHAAKMYHALHRMFANPEEELSAGQV